jgi:Cd2+/Zn2+-exporting ATPase
MTEMRLDDDPVPEPAVGSVRPGRSFVSRYSKVLRSTDFLAATATFVFAVASWLVSLVATTRTPSNMLAIAAAAVGGSVIAVGAVRGLLKRQTNVDELVTIAIVASVAVGEYLGAALVAFMMLFGKVLEDITAARAEAAIEGLGQLVPATARLVDAEAPGGERSVPVSLVHLGQTVAVRPGERIPVDGTVVSGRANVQEAAITGEPLPVSKSAGDECFAGTLVSGGALQVKTTRVGEATTLGRIATLVQEAEAERAPIVRVADRWAKWFTPAVLLIAAATYLVRGDLLPAVSVLVVACPCALVLATPTAIVAGIARGALAGILLRGGSRLEAAGHVDSVCIDKTGTLTLARPSIQRILTLDDRYDEATVLGFAAAAERLSEHPLARAILDAAADRAISAPPTTASGGEPFEAIPGVGVRVHVKTPMGPTVRVAVGNAGIAGDPAALPDSARRALDEVDRAGHTPVVVAVDDAVVAVIAVSDTIRPEAAEAVAQLRATGVKQIILLTGDRAGAASAVAAQVGISTQDVYSGLRPEQKLDRIRRLREQGHEVAMIGDGVNDAPALAAANVGIAMGGTGTDLTLSTADIVLMSDDLRQAAAAITLSRRTLAVIWQNLTFAALWNGIALLAVTVLTVGPVAAALVHNVGSVAVVANAARLVRVRIKK